MSKMKYTAPDFGQCFDPRMNVKTPETFYTPEIACKRCKSQADIQQSGKCIVCLTDDADIYRDRMREEGDA